jgi:hypothetical protein
MIKCDYSKYSLLLLSTCGDREDDTNINNNGPIFVYFRSRPHSRSDSWVAHSERSKLSLLLNVLRRGFLEPVETPSSLFDRSVAVSIRVIH